MLTDGHIGDFGLMKVDGKKLKSSATTLAKGQDANLGGLRRMRTRTIKFKSGSTVANSLLLT